MRRFPIRLLSVTVALMFLAVCLPVSADTSDAADPPSSYSNRSKCLAVRDQGAYDIGWAFALAGSIEVLMKVNGDQVVQISPLYFAGSLIDNTDIHKISNKVTSMTGSTLLDVGFEVGMKSVLYQYGPVAESDVPYSLASGSYMSDDAMKAKDIVHITGTAGIPLSERNDVKQAIIDYGSGMLSIFEYGYGSGHENYYREAGDDLAYNAPTIPGRMVNHGVQVVGWDDNYSKENFPAANKPLSNGAWLVKNSRGAGGEKASGYMWVSYESAMADQMFFVTSYDANTATETYTYGSGISSEHDSDLTHKYYDDSGADEMIKYAVVFEAKETAVLTAVTIDMGGSRNSNYGVLAYTELNEGYCSDPTLGERHVVELYMDYDNQLVYGGIRTATPSEPIVLEKGTRFSVVVQHYAEEVYYPVDLTEYNSGHYISDPVLSYQGCFLEDFQEEERVEEETGDWVTIWKDMATLDMGLHVTVSTASIIKSKTVEGVDVEYSISKPATAGSDGEVAVKSSTPDMPAISNDTTGSVTIPAWLEFNGSRYIVTSIGENAFEGCDRVSRVIVPPTASAIGEDAFKGCTGLNTLWIPKSVRTFDGDPFPEMKFRGADGNIPLIHEPAVLAGASYVMQDGFMRYHKDIYTVSYDADGGSITPMPFSWEEGTVFEIDEYKGEKEGYGFDCWEFDGKHYEVGSSFTMWNQDVLFKASWAAPKPNISDGAYAGIIAGSSVLGAAIIGFSLYRMKKLA